MQSARPLSGVRLAFAAFEPFPSHKGSGTRMRALLTGLRDAGAEVTLVSLAPKSGTEAQAIAGIDHRTVRVREPNYLSRGLRFRRAVLGELAASRADVVWVRGVFEGAAARAYHAMRGARVLADINGLPSVELRYHYPAFDNDLEAKFRREEEVLLRSAHGLTTQSNTTAAFLAQRAQLDVTRISVVPNAANPSAFSPGNEASGRIVYVGTLAPWQGVVELMMAVRRVGRERDVKLEIVGPAKRLWIKQLRRIQRRLKIDHAVHYHGGLGHSETASVVSSASICVAPLRADIRNAQQGCSPIKVFEYMSAGKVALSSDLACVREIVDHQETGWLAPRAQPRHLAAAITTLLDDAKLRASLGEAARNKICRAHTWAHRQSQWNAEVTRLLS